MFGALFGGLWLRNLKGNESLRGGLGLFMRSQAIYGLIFAIFGFWACWMVCLWWISTSS
jgi:hypothetical protein